jgi:DNA-binding MarR family transcriptional regulator
MYSGKVDVSELHRLGRRLIALARSAAGADSEERKLVPGQEAVLEDVLRNPDSTVSEIRDRTGFTQSHVSASVAQLRAWQLINAAPDPEDRRRTRLTATPAALETILDRAHREIDDAVAGLFQDQRDARRVLDLLAELSQLLGTQTPATTATSRQPATATDPSTPPHHT